MIRSLRVALGITALFAATACASQPDPATPTMDEAQQAETQGTAKVSAPTLPGGAGKLQQALAKIDLRPAQRATVDAILSDLAAKTSPVRKARADLATVIAQGVADGKLDDASISPAITALESAASTGKVAFQAAANQLHATLDASQRKALVAALRDTMSGRHPKGPRARIQKLATDLSLTDQQLRAIRESFTEGDAGAPHDHSAEHRHEVHARLQAIATAFESDSFDAVALGVGDQLVGHAADRITHGVNVLRRILPLLTPDQRAKAAERIRALGSASEETFAD